MDHVKRFRKRFVNQTVCVCNPYPMRNYLYFEFETIAEEFGYHIAYDGLQIELE